MSFVWAVCNNSGMDAARDAVGMISFQLNGETVSVRDAPLQTTLLDFVRERGLTGAKEGCAEGECGACAVVMVKTRGARTAYVPFNSCLMFLPMAAGQEIYTVEALARRQQLNPVQSAMVEHGGSQCGYCTPGFVMSLFAEYYRPGRTGSCDPHALDGNLCRCTGYRPIRDAALSLGPAPDDEFRRRLATAAPVAEGFSYVKDAARFSRPLSLEECLGMVSEDAEARLVAGGTDLAVESNLRGRVFPHLISVEAVPDLLVFRETANHVEIGAALTLAEIEALWADPPRAVREWLPLFASPLIRNRATLGGNLATASPIGDAAPLLLSLDVQVKLANTAGVRVIPLSSFFLDYRKTALEPGELVLSVVIPKPFPSFARFFKAAKRRSDDISTVAACFAVTLDGSGRISKARFSYGGVAPMPARVAEAEDALTGAKWDEMSARRAAAIVGRTLRPISDHRGSANYRLELAQSLLKKFCYETSEAAA